MNKSTFNVTRNEYDDENEDEGEYEDENEDEYQDENKDEYQDENEGEGENEMNFNFYRNEKINIDEEEP